MEAQDLNQIEFEEAEQFFRFKVKCKREDFCLNLKNIIDLTLAQNLLCGQLLKHGQKSDVLSINLEVAKAELIEVFEFHPFITTFEPNSNPEAKCIKDVWMKIKQPVHGSKALSVNTIAIVEEKKSLPCLPPSIKLVTAATKIYSKDAYIKISLEVLICRKLELDLSQYLQLRICDPNQK